MKVGRFALIISVLGTALPTVAGSTLKDIVDSPVISALVGLAALYQAVSFKVIQHRWGHESAPARAH